MGDAMSNQYDDEIRCRGPGCRQWQKSDSNFCSDRCKHRREGADEATKDFEAREQYIRKDERRQVIDELAVWVGVKNKR